MKSITSRDNPLFKELKQLATSAQARRKAQRTLLDGVHLCQAYLQNAGAPQICIVADSNTTRLEVIGLLAQCEQAGTQCVSLPDVLYQTLSQVENGIGILFVITAPSTVAPQSLCQNAVALDNLQDPGNLGSILRSAAAAGITQVLCSVGTTAAWSPKVLRAGMGAHFLLNIVENVDLYRLLPELQIPVIATSSYATQSIYEAKLDQPLVWLFGHEGQGVADELMAIASATVMIPQRPQIESLNVAASAAICFFEQVRQNLKSGFLF